MCSAALVVICSVVIVWMLVLSWYVCNLYKLVYNLSSAVHTAITMHNTRLSKVENLSVPIKFGSSLN